MLLLITAIAFAQTPAGPPQGRPPGPKKTPEERATAISNRLEKDLVLSAVQKTAVHDVALTKEKKMEELRNKNLQDSTAMKAEHKKINEEFRDGMKKALTPEQFKKWEAEKKDRREEGPPPPPPMPPSAPKQ